LPFIGPRLGIGFGFARTGSGRFRGANLPRLAAGADFLPGPLVQAVGQSRGLTAGGWLFPRRLGPAGCGTCGADQQTGRRFRAALGAGFIQTFVRVREQVWSNLIGQHVTTGSFATVQRLQDYAGAVAARSSGQTGAGARATALLAHAVQTQANVLAYIDSFMV